MDPLKPVSSIAALARPPEVRQGWRGALTQHIWMNVKVSFISTTLYGSCMEYLTESTECYRISLSRVEILYRTIIKIIKASFSWLFLRGEIGPFHVILLDSTRAFEILVSEEHFLWYVVQKYKGGWWLDISPKQIFLLWITSNIY